MMITDVESYFLKGCGRCPRFDTADCATKIWAEGLASLRRLCRAAGLAEVAKWGHPCYMAHGRNIAIIGAHRQDFRLSFFEAALMTDPDGVLERQGPNTAHADMIRFTDPRQPQDMADTISRYLTEAIGYAEAGLRAPRMTGTPELPEELTDALDADPPLAEAFHALTPGRQKSHVIQVGAAKKPETRVARIARLRDKIMAGKGATER